MSLSRRSSRNEPAGAAGRCPSCGSTRVAAVVEDVLLHVGKRTHRFTAVAHERCAQCGERIFGIDASKRFDAALPKRGRRAA